MRTQWEFACTEVPGGNIAALLKHLQTLGDAGWEPFHMQYIQLPPPKIVTQGQSPESIGKMIVFCKRPISETETQQLQNWELGEFGS
jgi:hypothetical protein